MLVPFGTGTISTGIFSVFANSAKNSLAPIDLLQTFQLFDCIFDNEFLDVNEVILYFLRTRSFTTSAEDFQTPWTQPDVLDSPPAERGFSTSLDKT